MKSLVAVCSISVVALALSACARPDGETFTELRSGDHLRIADCSYRRMLSRYPSVREDNFDALQRVEIHYDVKNKPAGYVAFDAAGRGRTLVEYKTRTAAKDPSWNVGALRGPVSSCAPRAGQ